MEKQHTEWKFLATTAFLVATVALPTLASLLSADAGEPTTMVLRATEQKTRKPASLPLISSTSSKSTKKSVVINDAKQELNNLLNNNLISYDFSCTKVKVTDFKVQGNFVQLKGRDCGKDVQMPKLSITNKTNGFTASVFFLNGHEYQTDLIQLKEGENKISIQYQYPSGQQEEHVLNVKAGTI